MVLNYFGIGKLKCILLKRCMVMWSLFVIILIMKERFVKWILV